MDTKQIEYILKIAEENNITKAAEKLFLTQPALNQQLLRLEKELGTQLFHRSRTNWRPTQAGEIYLENARKMLLIKQETYRIIGDMVSDKEGTLSVGLTPGRGIAMFSAVYPKFHQKFPGIHIIPVERSVKNQQEMIVKGELDIGFQTLCPSQRTGDEYIELGKEEILLALPKKHPLSSLEKNREEVYPELDIKLLSEDPFVLMYQESTIRYLIDRIFQEADFVPNVLFETSSTSAIITMIQAGLCCGLIPMSYFRTKPEGIACFSLPSHPVWDVVASYRKNSYLTRASKYFIRLAGEFWGY
ncbi:MAG: LysR family transcriptional regulator [Paenibacillaceae bacterium]|nr:LysR family transcriptional regulator [Paenibacillaceae bacterium]